MQNYPEFTIYIYGTLLWSFIPLLVFCLLVFNAFFVFLSNITLIQSRFVPDKHSSDSARFQGKHLRLRDPRLGHSKIPAREPQSETNPIRQIPSIYLIEDDSTKIQLNSTKISSSTSISRLSKANPI